MTVMAERTQLTAGITPQQPRESAIRGWGVALVLAILFFLSHAAQLTKLEFSGGSELLVVGTVLEIKRNDTWWVPTLRGKPRLIKPPLTAWIGATAVTEDTVRALDDPDADKRAAAYQRLAWQVRWPPLLATTLMLLGVFELGRVTLGTRVALVGMVAAGTSLLMMRFGRFATTDVMLALWVTWAQVGLAHAALLGGKGSGWGGWGGRRWAGCAVAGAALGLAFMSKGPVAFVFTLIPFTAAVAYGVWRRDWSMGIRQLAGPAGVLLLGFVALGLPWYLDQFRMQGMELLESWKREVLREGATQLPRDPIWTYLSLLLLMAPWVVFGIAGFVIAALERATQRRLFEVAMAVVLPVLVMSLFKDKNERYLLPLAGVCGLLAGFAIVRAYTTTMNKSGTAIREFAMSIPWIMGVGLAVAGAVGGAFGDQVMMVTKEGAPWHSWTVAASIVTVMAGFFAMGRTLERRLWWAPFAAAAASMVLSGAVFMNGYSQSANGRSSNRPVAERIRTEYPGRPIYELWDTPLRSDHDLNVYLNRVLPGVATPAEVAEHNAVLLMIRRTSAADPEVPPGWRLSEQLPANKRKVFVLERQ